MTVPVFSRRRYSAVPAARARVGPEGPVAFPVFSSRTRTLQCEFADAMLSSRRGFRGQILRHYQPTIVRTSKEAYELSERLFSRLGAFAFDGAENTRLVSSGPQIQGGSIQLISSTGHRIAIRDDDKLTVLVPFAGAIRVARGRQTETAHPSELLIVQPGRRETHLSRNYLGALIQVPIGDADRLENGWRELTGRLRHARGVTRLASPSVVASAHRLVEAIERRPLIDGRPDRWAGYLTRLWETVALALDGHADPDPSAASLDQVRRAEAFMASRSAEAMSLGAIARAVDVGPRSLQLAFQRHRRRTPFQFLEECRLLEARERLARPAPGATVTSVAHDCGFTHLGRFSTVYHGMFGESPSRSLRGGKRSSN
ncbi:MAG: helix-turn-helix domain-containing protein [Hyphomicrobiaceae bacterium]